MILDWQRLCTIQNQQTRCPKKAKENMERTIRGNTLYDFVQQEENISGTPNKIYVTNINVT